MRVSELLEQINRLSDLERLAVSVRKRHEFVLVSAEPSRLQFQDLATIPMRIIRDSDNA